MEHYVSLGLRPDAVQQCWTEQERPTWCWAACIKMILGYHGIPIDQERLVRAMTGIDPYVRLDLGADEQTITRALNANLEHNGKKFSITANYIPGTPAPVTLINELVKGCPIVVAYQATPQSRHTVLVTWVEYVMRNGTPGVYQIRVLDPWPGQGAPVYDASRFARSIVGAWTVDVSVYQVPWSFAPL